MVELEYFKCSGKLFLCFYKNNHPFPFRVVSTIMITARNVTFALNGVPQSFDAYEAGERILGMIKESEKELRTAETNKV